MHAGSTAPERPDRSQPLCLQHTQLHSACRDRGKTGEPHYVLIRCYLFSSEQNIQQFVFCDYCYDSKHCLNTSKLHFVLQHSIFYEGLTPGLGQKDATKNYFLPFYFKPT